MSSESFARRLRRVRQAAGLSVADLAQASGLHRVALHRLERGERRPRLDTLQRLARALRCTLDQLG